MKLFSKFSPLISTIILILIVVILSMILLSYYQVDMNDNDGLRVLNRGATFGGSVKEGYLNKERRDQMQQAELERLKNSKKFIDKIKYAFLLAKEKSIKKAEEEKRKREEAERREREKEERIRKDREAREAAAELREREIEREKSIKEAREAAAAAERKRQIEIKLREAKEAAAAREAAESPVIKEVPDISKDENITIVKALEDKEDNELSIAKEIHDKGPHIIEKKQAEDYATSLLLHERAHEKHLMAKNKLLKHLQPALIE